MQRNNGNLPRILDFGGACGELILTFGQILGEEIITNSWIVESKQHAKESKTGISFQN